MRRSRGLVWASRRAVSLDTQNSMQRLTRRNVAAKLKGSRQTNQRAELTAVQKAVTIAPRDRSIVICTDSQYSIDCLTKWFVTWRKNGWKTSTKQTVENKDLIESILAKMESRHKLGAHTKFEWTKGHASDQGNIEADRLANQGARLST